MPSVTGTSFLRWAPIMAVFFANLMFAFVRKAPAPANPWGQGATTLKWTLPSPPPFHQFDTLPRVVGPSLDS